MAEQYWIPTQNFLGYLPTSNEGGEPVKFEVDVNAKQILVYAFISTHDLISSTFQRGYYEIFTKDDLNNEFKYYMNVCFGGGSGDTAINSGNFWLPYGPNYQRGVFIRLVLDGEGDVKPKKPPKSLAGKSVAAVLQEHSKQSDTEPEAIYSGVFLTGIQR